MANTAIGVDVRAHLHGGYLTREPQWDAPEARWTVRVRLSMRVGDETPTTRNLRILWTAADLGPLRRAAAGLGARLLPRWPRVAGALLGFAVGGIGEWVTEKHTERHLSAALGR